MLEIKENVNLQFVDNKNSNCNITLFKKDIQNTALFAKKIGNECQQIEQKRAGNNELKQQKDKKQKETERSGKAQK